MKIWKLIEPIFEAIVPENFLQYMTPLTESTNVLVWMLSAHQEMLAVHSYKQISIAKLRNNAVRFLEVQSPNLEFRGMLKSVDHA